MRRNGLFSLGVMAAMLLMAAISAATAAGTELYKETGATDDTLGRGTTVQMTLKSGTSLIIRDTAGNSLATCSSSELAVKLDKSGWKGGFPVGNATVAIGACANTHVNVITPGKLSFEHIPGTTNGYLRSSQAELTFNLTTYGIDALCKTGEGTSLGTVTGGAAGGHAILSLNSVLNCGSITLRMTGTLTVTSPTGLIVEEGQAEPELGTELYRVRTAGNVTQGVGTEIQGSLKAGSSLVLKDSFGFTDGTCTGSELALKTESAGGEASHPSGKVSTLAFSGCGGATTVHAKGSLEIKHIAGTTNGTVTSSGMEVTFYSPAYGEQLACQIGAGTDIGTLTGVKTESHATLDVDATMNCLWMGYSISHRLTGTYTITAPAELNVEAAPSSGTELYRGGESASITQGVGTEIQSSLKAETSATLKDTAGATAVKCSGSEIGLKIESVGGGGFQPTGKASTLTFSGCNATITVHSKGNLEVEHIAGATNGTVTSSGMEVTFQGTPFGDLTCKTGAGTDIGTLTGVNTESQATLDVNAAIDCSGISSRLAGTYTITTPKGLNVEAS